MGLSLKRHEFIIILISNYNVLILNADIAINDCLHKDFYS